MVTIRRRTTNEEVNTTLRVEGTTNAVSNLVLNPTSVLGGQSVQLEVRLGEAAPIGSATVELWSANSRVNISNSVRIPSGEFRWVLTIDTLDVTREEQVEVNAFYANTQGQVVLTVRPAGSVILSSISLNPANVVAGQSVTARVDLTGPAPLGALRFNCETTMRRLCSLCLRF